MAYIIFLLDRVGLDGRFFFAFFLPSAGLEAKHPMSLCLAQWFSRCDSEPGASATPGRLLGMKIPGARARSETDSGGWARKSVF